MKYLSSSILLAALTLFCNCNKNNADKTVSTDSIPAVTYHPIPDDPDSLAYWFAHEDSINHTYVCLAGDIWHDDVNIYDIDSLLDWRSSHEKKLADAFSSEHPKSSLSAADKADQMVSILYEFFPIDKQLTTAGMLAASDLEYKMFAYHFATECDRLLKHNPDMRDEMMTWGELHKHYSLLCKDFALINYDGGSMSVLVASGNYNSIVSKRIQYIQNLNAIYENRSKDIAAKKVDEQAATIFTTLANRNVRATRNNATSDFPTIDKETYDELKTDFNNTISAFAKWRKAAARIKESDSDIKNKIHDEHQKFISDLSTLLENEPL